MGYKRELEIASESLRQMHRRGIRILPGGDYGFAWMPHGTNANDLQYFVDYIGMTPTEALVSAARLGGQMMMRPDELGMLRAGYLADVVIVPQHRPKRRRVASAGRRFSVAGRGDTGSVGGRGVIGPLQSRASKPNFKPPDVGRFYCFTRRYRIDSRAAGSGLALMLRAEVTARKSSLRNRYWLINLRLSLINTRYILQASTGVTPEHGMASMES